MWAFIVVVSFIAIFVGLVASIVYAIKRNIEWKKWLIITGAAFAVFVVAAMLDPSQPEQQPDITRGNQQEIAATSHPISAANNETKSHETENISEESSIPLIEVVVTRVVDGDTLNATINGAEEKIRLIGVDTPETVHPTEGTETYGKEASDYTKARLEGKTVYLEKDVQERDKYGRILAYVWMEQPGEVNDNEISTKMFNSRLLVNGLAQLMTIPPNVKYVDQFTKLQADARKSGFGVWSISPDPTPETESTTTATQDTSPVVTPAQETSASDTTVYVTNTGKKYHRDGCRHLAKSKIPMALSSAKSSYGPCGTCKPPR